MNLKVNFAIISDLHVAIPDTIWNQEHRFHLVEFSIPVLEFVLENLEKLPLDFILIPGDLTQHGEKDNHNQADYRKMRKVFRVLPDKT